MSDNFKFQINVRIGDALYNVRGETPAEFEANVNAAITALPGVAELVSTARAVDSASPLIGTQSVAPASTPAPAAVPAQAPSQGDSDPVPFPVRYLFNGAERTCSHGPRNYRTGNGPKGPWHALFCAAPKGTPNACAAIGSGLI